MAERDLILDSGNTPGYDQIFNYMNETARAHWQDLNSFIQQKYKASPKIMYSKCSSKPGWNVKYNKSGKSLCTLYPEKEGFIALVVITLDLIPAIEAIGQFQEEILELIRSSRPFNGTLWLMIRVNRAAVVDNVKDLLLLKDQRKLSAKG